MKGFIGGDEDCGSYSGWASEYSLDVDCCDDRQYATKGEVDELRNQVSALNQTIETQKIMQETLLQKIDRLEASQGLSQTSLLANLSSVAAFLNPSRLSEKARLCVIRISLPCALLAWSVYQHGRLTASILFLLMVACFVGLPVLIVAVKKVGELERSFLEGVQVDGTESSELILRMISDWESSVVDALVKEWHLFSVIACRLISADRSMASSMRFLSNILFLFVLGCVGSKKGHVRACCLAFFALLLLDDTFSIYVRLALFAGEVFCSSMFWFPLESQHCSAASTAAPAPRQDKHRRLRPRKVCVAGAKKYQ